MQKIHQLRNYPAFIDESVDMGAREFPYYLLSAVVLLGENQEVTKSFLEKNLSLGFKASKHSSRKKHRTLHAF